MLQFWLVKNKCNISEEGLSWKWNKLLYSCLKKDVRQANFLLTNVCLYTYFLIPAQSPWYIKKTLWPLFMDGVQLPQGYSHFEEAVYFLPLRPQKFLVLILLTAGEWMGRVDLEVTQWFRKRDPLWEIQRLNY